MREVGELKDGGGFELSWVCSTFFSHAKHHHHALTFVHLRESTQHFTHRSFHRLIDSFIYP